MTDSSTAHRRSAAVAATIVALAAVLFALAELKRRGTPTGLAQHDQSNASIQAVRSTPPAEAGIEVECASLAFANFTYEVFNGGQRPLRGLKLGTTCSCEVLGNLPDEILPGTSAAISFRVRAPYVGRIQKKVPLLAEGGTEPICVFDAALTVTFEPPRMVPMSRQPNLTFIEPGGKTRDLVLETIEAKADAHWLRGLALDPADSVEVGAFDLEELREADPDLVRRRYRFPLLNRSLRTGRHSVGALVLTSDSLPLHREPLMIAVEVVDEVAIVPSQVVFKSMQGESLRSRRVRVIDRMKNPVIAAPVRYDRELLRVDAAAGRSENGAVFEITPTENPHTKCETEVVFNVGGNETRTLLVCFEPQQQR